MLRASSVTNLKKDLNINGKGMTHSQSNSFIKSKGKAGNRKISESISKGGEGGGFNKSPMQLSMTNNRSTIFLGSNYYNDSMKIFNAENKIVKRVNRKDYNIDAVYGKPSHIFLLSKNTNSSTPQDYNNKNNRTFKKFNSQSQGRSPEVNTCEVCREMYKKMVMNQEEFQPLKCLNCGNVLNEGLFNYYLKLYSFSLFGKQFSNNRYIDEGKMNGEWTKWIQLQTGLKKENLAYDIVNGNTKLKTQNEKDKQLKIMIANTKPVLKRKNKSTR